MDYSDPQDRKSAESIFGLHPDSIHAVLMGISDDDPLDTPQGCWGAEIDRWGIDPLNHPVYCAEEPTMIVVFSKPAEAVERLGVQVCDKHAALVRLLAHDDFGVVHRVEAI